MSHSELKALETLFIYVCNLIFNRTTIGNYRICLKECRIYAAWFLRVAFRNRVWMFCADRGKTFISLRDIHSVVELETFPPKQTPRILYVLLFILWTIHYSLIVFILPLVLIRGSAYSFTIGIFAQNSGTFLRNLRVWQPWGISGILWWYAADVSHVLLS